MTHSANVTSGWVVLATLLALGGCEDDSLPDGSDASGGTADHVAGGTAGASGKRGGHGVSGGATAGGGEGGGDAAGDDSGGSSTPRGGAGGSGAHAAGGSTGEGATGGSVDEGTAGSSAGEGATGRANGAGGSDAGTSGDAGSTSEDVDECATDNGGCDPVAECTDGHGTRWCVCPPGYRGDGITCTLIDPCPCENGGQCVEHKGNVVCDCVPGTSGPTCSVRTRRLASLGSCSLMTDDTVQCWGPKEMPRGSPPAFVEISDWGTCGLTANGDAYCWDGDTGWPLVGTNVASVHVCLLYTDGRFDCGEDLRDWNEILPPHAGGDTTWMVHPDGWASVWGETPAPTRSVKAFAAGRAVGALGHSCTIETDGTLSCAGNNDAGQASPPPGTFTELALGRRHSCAQASDGTAVCWGDDTYGQSSPPSGAFQSITAGDDHNCGLRSTGLVECWGRNDSGQATPPYESFTRVAAGEAHTCGLRTNKTILCWGNDAYGQATPPPAIDRQGFNELAVGARHSCGIDGVAVRCWGDNSRGQAPSLANGYGWITAGREHTCAVDPSYQVVCWGNGDAGQTTPSYQPTVFQSATAFRDEDRTSIDACGVRTDGSVRCTRGVAVPPAGPFKSIAYGAGQFCAMRVDGTVRCWRSTTFPGGSEPSSPRGRFASLALNAYTSCGLHPDGSAECWNDAGYDSPMLHPPAEKFTDLANGGGFACGLRADGTLRCWGNELDPGAMPPTGVFRAVAYADGDYCGVKSSGSLYCTDSRGSYGLPPSGPFVDVSLSSYAGNACGRRPDGSLECWGSYSETPPLGTFHAVAVGLPGTSDCAIRDDGTVTCWGPSSPGAPPDGQYLSVSMGSQTGVAVRADHKAISWGLGAFSLTPPATPPSDSFVQIDIGGEEENTCGVRTDGTLECWTAEFQGSTVASLWTDLPTGTFSSVSVGHGGACGLRTDGTLACFRRDSCCAVLPPITPSGQFDAADTAVGFYDETGCGVRPDGRLECWGGIHR